MVTPHKAEFKAFFGVDVPKKLSQKIDVVLEYSKECKCTVVLKGMWILFQMANLLNLIYWKPRYDSRGYRRCISWYYWGFVG